MRRDELLENAVRILKKHGFKVAVNDIDERYCFDIMASHEERGEVVTVKVSENLDKVTQSIAKELKALSEILDAAPLVVSEKSRRGVLEEGVMYSHFELTGTSVETFSALASGREMPLVYSSKGGFYVKIDGAKLREERINRGLSLGDLAYKLRVSRRAVFSYESGKSDLRVEVASRLYEILGETPFVKTRGFRSIVRERPKKGRIVYGFRRTPFDAGARIDVEDKKLIIANVSGHDSEEIILSQEVASASNSELLLVETIAKLRKLLERLREH